MKLFVTGHRPDKLGGYDRWAPLGKVYSQLYKWVAEAFRDYRPIEVVTGMALGFDQLCAQVAVDLGIPFVAAVPFVGQDERWPADARSEYRRLIALAKRVAVVSPGGYDAWKMQARNKWMVNYADRGIACWDGSPGGTANCVEYARIAQKPIVSVDPRGWLR